MEEDKIREEKPITKNSFLYPDEEVINNTEAIIQEGQNNHIRIAEKIKEVIIGENYYDVEQALKYLKKSLRRSIIIPPRNI